MGRLDHGGVVIYTSLEHLGWHVGAHFFGMFVAKKLGVAAFVHGGDGLFHGLRWWWRWWGQLPKVFAAIPLNRRTCACASGICKFGNTFVGRYFWTRDGWRLIAGAAGAAHPLCYPFEGHADALTYTTTTPAMRVG